MMDVRVRASGTEDERIASHSRYALWPGRAVVAMMDQGGDFLASQRFHYGPWRELLRALCGRHDPEAIEPSALAGFVRPLSVCGFAALDVSCNAHQVERTHHYVRTDRPEHYYAVFQVAGRSTMIQNDRAVHLVAGDVALVDAATRPPTYFSISESAQWRSLHLPRQSLISHLGFEPKGGYYPRGATVAKRLLFDAVLAPTGSDGSPPSPADSYLQLAVYDLLGAVFAPDSRPLSGHTDKLITRIRGVIKRRFTDPDLSPRQVAAQAGISLRYLQKLFTERGATCIEFIYSLRLDHAARLVQRRALLRSKSPPLSEIAYACGFRDYSHFARKFRDRFGQSPRAHTSGHGLVDDVTERVSTDTSVPSARDP